MKLLSLTLAILLVVAGVPAPTTADGDGRPLADAGLDQSTTVGSTVYLDGGGSLDPDGEIVEYRWSIETPRGETIHPENPDAVTTQFVPDETGRYAVQLTVTGDDGQSQSDTLYVDVEEANDRAPAPTPTPTATPTETATPSSQSTPTPEPSETPSVSDPSTPVPTTDEPTSESNQPPTGSIVGPSSVSSGSTVSFSIRASDPDGHVVDRWWPPTTLSTSGGQSRVDGSTRSLTIEGTPGSSVGVTAVVEDDDGATSTLTKTVEVLNSPPTASIEGESIVAVNTTEEYRVIATDPDGQITSVGLTDGSGAVEPVTPLSGTTPRSSGEWARSFRFTDIPEDDGTVVLEARVVDDQGGVTRVEKEITIVENVSESTSYGPASQSAPEIHSLDVTLQDGPDGINTRQALFTATASDPDSSRLTFEWRIGDVAVLRNRANGTPADAKISYALEDQQIQGGEIDVTLQVSDQNGNQNSVSKTLEIGPVSGGSTGRAYSMGVTSVVGRTVQGTFSMDQSHVGEIVVISFGDGISDTITLGDTTVHHFSHKYASGGDYSITVNPGWSPDSASIPVDVDKQTYSVYTYERKESVVHRTTAAESPGEDWTQGEIDHINREQIGANKTQTLANGGKGLTSPGQEWTRVGTTTEYHDETRTTESISSPGSDWTLSQRNVGQRQVFSEWQYTSVPQRGLLGGNWEYVGRVSRTVDRTESKESTNRPDGDGWSKGEEVRETQVDYRTEWVDMRFHAESHWEYLESDQEVEYESKVVCAEYGDYTDPPTCIRTKTEYYPTYDTVYKYRVPVYEPVYEWTRTVEETEYEYQYRSATYTLESVHEYKKEVRVGTEFVQWERPVIDRTNIYRWKLTEDSWVQKSSFSEPIGSYRNLTRVVRECGTAAKEPVSCEEDS